MNLQAWSILNIESLDSQSRVIRGIATSPQVDRAGDIVEPLGITYADDMPLLWQHDASKPVGRVKFGKPTKDGVPFEATLPLIGVDGALKARVDEAWQSVVYGLVRAVSIGFRALVGGHEQLKDGGVRFTKTEVMELSLVTIPANSQAVITAVKSFDLKSQSPGVSGFPLPLKKCGVVFIIPKGKRK